MDRFAIIARLRPDAAAQAAELIASGPPFDPHVEGFERHGIYLSATEVIFVFEGPEVEGLVDDLIGSPFNWMVSEAFDQWRPLVDGPPRIAREKFFWQRDEAAPMHAAEPENSSIVG